MLVSLTISLSFEHFRSYYVYRDECSKTRVQHGYNWKFSLMFARFSPPGDPVRRSTRVYYVLNINTLRARGINRAVVVGGGDQPRYVRGTFGPGSPRYHLCQLSWCRLLPPPVMRRYQPNKVAILARAFVFSSRRLMPPLEY